MVGALSILPIKKGDIMKIKIIKEGGRFPERHGNLIDLFTSEQIYLQQGEDFIMPLGVAVKVPDGDFPVMFQKRDSFRKYGVLLASGTSIVDAEDGAWSVHVVALRETIIPEGACLCQFTLFRKEEELDLIEVET